MTNSNKTVIDLFAGAGGFGLGFTLAGYDVSTSLEIDKWASDTLKENNKHTIINDSILNFNTKAKISKVIKDKPDIIIGGPPCQGFSLAGRRNKLDPRNKLFIEYFNWVKILKPKIFVIENVHGILTFRNESGEKVVDEIQNLFSSLGYTVNVWQINASEYGVPQVRNRVFIVGNFRGELIPKPIISHSFKLDNLPNPVTVKEAIFDLPKIQAAQGGEVLEYDQNPQTDFQIWCRENSLAVYNHEAMKHTQRMVARYIKIIEGSNLSELHDDLKVRKRNGAGVLSDANYSLNYRHLKMDVPSFTIPAHFYSSFVHPEIPRNITTREAARLQSFPDWYKFKGKRTLVSASLLRKLGKEEANHLSQYNQVGNAVPPLLAFKIAEHLRHYF